MAERTRVVFMGSAEVSCVALAELLKTPWLEVVGAVTQPDRPVGRSLRPSACPGKAFAEKNGIPVFAPEKVNAPESLAHIWSWAPDVIVVVAYGQILRKALLEMPKYGCVNLHLSLLPRHRGAAPVKWAIAEGDPRTGATVMLMDQGMDTGDILAQSVEDILPRDTAETLTARLASRGAALLAETLHGLVEGTVEPTPQNSLEATYAPKLTKQDGCVTWNSDAARIVRRIKAFQPWPGGYTTLLVTHGNAEPKQLRVRIFEAEAIARRYNDKPVAPGTIAAASASEGIVVATEQGSVRLLEIQAEGGRRMSAHDFLAGHHVPVGAKLP